jgi:16S rRNA (uracil1498-N3)-methyltransferase
MSIPRLHADALLEPGLELALTPGQAHHVGTVLRRAAGAELRVFNARDGEFAATLTALKRDRGAVIAGAAPARARRPRRSCACCSPR